MNFKNLYQARKWQLALYGVLLVAVIVIMVALRSCGGDGAVVNSGTRADVKSGGDTIDVAIEYSPLSYYAYGDTLGGFNYEFLQLVARTCAVNFKYHPIVRLQVALDGLESGLYDVMAAQFPVTLANKERYLFTQAIYLDKQVLLQLNDSINGLRINSQLDLAGDTVTIVKGSPMRERIVSLAREIGDTIHIVSDSVYGPEQLFLMVATGDVKLAVINESIARKMAATHPGVDISKDISFTQFQSLTLSKDNSGLLTKLNTWIATVKKTPQYKELLNKYFSKNPPSAQPKYEPAAK